MITDIFAKLETTKRPKLLMQAARYAVPMYRRKSDLARILKTTPPMRQDQVVTQLMFLEQELNEKRRQNDAAYFVTDHVDCLAALLSETVLLQREQTDVV